MKNILMDIFFPIIRDNDIISPMIIMSSLSYLLFLLLVVWIVLAVAGELFLAGKGMAIWQTPTKEADIAFQRGEINSTEWRKSAIRKR